MSFRHLLSPILRRLGVSGSTTNASRVIAREIHVPEVSSKLEKEAKSTSIDSLDKIRTDTVQMTCSKVSNADSITQNCDRISLRCEPAGDIQNLRCNIRRGSSCAEVTLSPEIVMKENDSSKNNNSINDSRSSEELRVNKYQQTPRKDIVMSKSQNKDFTEHKSTRNGASSSNKLPNRTGKYDQNRLIRLSCNVKMSFQWVHSFNSKDYYLLYIFSSNII